MAFGQLPGEAPVTPEPNYFDQFDGQSAADQLPSSARPPSDQQLAQNVSDNSGVFDASQPIVQRGVTGQIAQAPTQEQPAARPAPASPPARPSQRDVVDRLLNPPEVPSTPAAPAATSPQPWQNQPPLSNYGAQDRPTIYDYPSPPLVYPGAPKPVLTPAVTPSFAVTVMQDVWSVTKDIADGVFREGPRATVRGVLKAAQNATTSANDLLHWLDDITFGKISVPSTGNAALDTVGGYVLDPGKLIQDGLDATVGSISAPTSGTGKIIQSASQFLAGFIPALRVMRAAGVTGIAANTAAGFASSALTTDANEDGLSNLIQKFPALQNPVTQYLATNPDDPKALNMLRHGVEMAGLGVVTDGIVRGVRFIASAKRARVSIDALRAQDEAVGTALGGEIDSALGNPNSPIVVVKPAAVPKQVPVSPMEAAGSKADAALGRTAADSALGVPDAVTARSVVQGAKDQTAAKAAVAGLKDENGLIPLMTRLEEAGPASPVQSGGQQIYLNFGRINTEEDIKAMMQQVADAFAPEVTAAKRGVQTLAETAQLADKIGLTVEEILARPRGMALNAEQITASNKVLTTAAENLWALAEKAAGSGASLADGFNFRKMLSVYRAIQMQVLGANAEAGRALGALRIERSTSGAGMTRQLNDIMDRLGGAQGTRVLGYDVTQSPTQQLAQNMLSLREAGLGEGALNQAASRGIFAWAMSAVRESYTLGLLWKPKTHIRNLTSNLVAQTQQVYERAAAAQFDNLMGTTAQEGAVVSGEATAYLFGQIEAIKDMLGLAGRAGLRAVGIGEKPVSELAAGFRAKYPDITANKMVDVAPAISSQGFSEAAGKTAAQAARFAETPMGQFIDYFGAATRVPGKMLQAGDFFFKAFGYAGEINAQALRQATSEGLTGRALIDRVADLRINPPVWLHEAAVDQALYSTFNQQAGEITRALMNIRNVDTIPNPTFLVATYLKTPSNILRYTANRTPLAIMSQHWRDDIAAGGARRSLALSRMATGTATIAAFIDYASSGFVTGPGPTDQAQQQALRNTGWQPWSVYSAGLKQYISYNNLDPFTQPMAFAAAVAEMVKAHDISPEDFDTLEEVVGHSISVVSASIVDKSYFQGYAQAGALIQGLAKDRTGSFQSYIGKEISSMVPFSSLLSFINEQTDPVRRDVADWWQAVMEPIPGLRQRLIPKRNRWGEPIKPEEVYGPWFNVVVPTNVTERKEAPIDRELATHRSGIATIPWKTTFQGVHMNFHDYPEVLDRYRVLAGNDLKDPSRGYLGAKDFLDAVVSGKNEMSQLYYSGTLTDGQDGTKVKWLKARAHEYEMKAQMQVLEEARTRWPEFYDFVVGKMIDAKNQTVPTSALPPGTIVPSAQTQRIP